MARPRPDDRLVGLLFIVISLRFDKISERAVANMRATIEVTAWMLMFGVFQAQPAGQDG